MMKNILFLSLSLSYFYSYSQNQCNDLRQKNENYAAGDDPISWCDFSKPTPYTKCKCEKERNRKATEQARTNEGEKFLSETTRLKNLEKQASDAGDYTTALDYLNKRLNFITNSETYKRSNAYYKDEMTNTLYGQRRYYEGKLKESGETESTYVYLKSPQQLLKEAETELLTISDPSERKLKEEKVSFLRESSIDMAGANGDHVNATRLQIERDNQNWNRVSESAGQLIGGVIANAMERREAKRSQEHRSMMEKEKRFIEFPKYLEAITKDYFEEAREISNVFKRYPATSMDEQKQRILQFILSAGNTLIATSSSSSESNREGLCMYVAEQTVNNAYFKNNTIHIEFTRKVKEARFDHPIRELGNRGYNKLKYYDIEKYVLNATASYDYFTKAEEVQLEIDWGVSKEKYKSLDAYRKYRTNKYQQGSFFKGTDGSRKELLLDYTESFLANTIWTDNVGFMDVLVMPKLINSFNESLTNTVLGANRFIDEASFTNHCTLLWEKAIEESGYETFLKLEAFIDAYEFSNTTLETYKKEIKMYKAARSVTTITIGSNGWTAGKEGSYFLRHCLNVRKIVFEDGINQETLNDWMSNGVIANNITTFDIAVKNSINYIPESLGDFRSLTSLKITIDRESNEAPFTIPNSIGNLENLEELIIAPNHFNIKTIGVIALPESLGNLKNLKSLITNHSRNLGDGMTIGTSYISSIPESIGDLKSLEILDLGERCPLEYIPESLWDLENLEKLTLGIQNEEIVISDKVGQMKKLIFFRTDWLKVKTLPISLSNIEKGSIPPLLKYEYKHLMAIDKEFTKELISKGIMSK